MSCSVSAARAFTVSGLLLLLAPTMVSSLVIDTKLLPASAVLGTFTGSCQSTDCTIVLDVRLPRTLAGLLIGGALGPAGALMQTLTHNPLADPGILGVNSGASFAIVLGAALSGFSPAQEQLLMTSCGALTTSLIVALAGGQDGGQLSLIHPTLMGVTLGAALEGLSTDATLFNPGAYDQLRFWQTGSLNIRNLWTLKVVPVPILITTAAALFLSRTLDSLDLDSDTATTLGSKIARTQFISLLVITILRGSATATVGSAAFIGLVTPYIVYWLVGTDHHWPLPVTLLTTSSLLLIANIIGRLTVPGELRVSVVSASIGAPMLVFLVRRKSYGSSV